MLSYIIDYSTYIIVIIQKIRKLESNNAKKINKYI